MTTVSPTKILFIEDVPADAELAMLELKKRGLDFQSELVDTREGLLSALESFGPNIVISDFSMPKFDGMSALLLVRERHPFLPFIVLTGSMNEETAVDCMKAGASDYVIKEHMSRLPFAVREALKHGILLKKHAEQENLLRQSEERYRSIFSNTHAVMMILDPKSSKVVDANQAAVDFYGWPKEELIGKPVGEINTLAPDMLREQLRRAVNTEKKSFLFRHRLADGSIRDVETHSGPVSIGDQVFLLSIIHDISDRIAAQRERDKLSEKLAHYLQTSPTITYSLGVQSGTASMTWISENVRYLLGYTVEEAMSPDWWFDNLVQTDRADALLSVSLVLEKGSYAHEYRFLRKDRTIIWIRDQKRLVEDNQGNGEIVGTLTDISDIKQAAQEINLKSTALEVLDTAMVITNRDGGIEWVNKAFETLTGFSRTESIGRNPRDLVNSGKHDAQFYKTMWDTILSGRSWRGELTNKKKSGELYQEEMTITPVMNSRQQIEHFIAVKADITERTRSRERIEASLREKEILLHEIHHRVNNNLQIVTSLLHLSSANITDSRVNSLLNEINRRITAMSIIHEMFYDTLDVSRIDFSVYLQHLAVDLLREYRVEPGEIEIIQRTESVMMDLETAIPVGLIVSEIASNSIKAIMGNKRQSRPLGRLTIAMRNDPTDTVTIEIADDGPGMPKSVDPATAHTMGMLLTRILAEQLRGSTDFASDKGTVVTLRFPLTYFEKKGADR